MSRHLRSRRGRAYLVAFGTAAVAIGIYAAVAVAGPSTGVINACALTGQGQLRIIGDGGSCKPNETAVSWNVEGPTGVTGATGATGNTGATGAMGFPGRDVHRKLRQLHHRDDHAGQRNQHLGRLRIVDRADRP